MGAGTCLHPDPLYQLLASPEGEASPAWKVELKGAGFLGLAVEADADRLHRLDPSDCGAAFIGVRWRWRGATLQWYLSASHLNESSKS